MSTLDTLQSTGDFVRLKGAGEYQAYFTLLTRVCKTIMSWYGRIEGGDEEGKVVAGFLQKILSTIEVLRVKQLHDADRHIALDLNESGFPHSQGIGALEVDARTAGSRLAAILPDSVLKEQMLDHMFIHKDEPVESLKQMGERRFLELIGARDLFLEFNQGDLVLQSTDEKYRHYVASWACFDFRSNCPYIHVMSFDQDVKARALEEDPEAYIQFWSTVKQEGANAAACAVIVTCIDAALRPIHPKILKRICLGPILSVFSREKHPLIDILLMAGGPEDFILLLTNEIVFSKAEELEAGGFFKAKKLRQIYSIPETDRECYIRKASRVSHVVMLPHHVHQAVDWNDGPQKEFQNRSFVTYNRKGEVYPV